MFDSLPLPISGMMSLFLSILQRWCATYYCVLITLKLSGLKTTAIQFCLIILVQD